MPSHPCRGHILSILLLGVALAEILRTSVEILGGAEDLGSRKVVSWDTLASLTYTHVHGLSHLLPKLLRGPGGISRSGSRYKQLSQKQIHKLLAADPH